MKKRSKLTELLKQLDFEIKETSSRSESISLQSLKEFIHEINSELEEVNILLEERSRNIKITIAHLNLQGELDYDLHENYHAILIKLRSTIKNIFSKNKQLLNMIVPLAVKKLPIEEKRGIKEKSFGKFINSLEGRCSEYSVSIYRKGKLIDSIYNEYRDKYIEHKKNNNLLDGIEFNEGSVNLISHSPKPIKVSNSLDYDLMRNGHIFKSKNKDVGVIFNPTTNQHIYYIHVSPLVTLGGGNSTIVIMSNNKEHFEKYGSHMHAFTIDGADLNDSPFKLNLNKTISPYFIDAVEDTFNLLLFILKA